MASTTVSGNEDLVSIPNITSDEIASTLYDRYQDDILYTRIGAKVLIGVASARTGGPQNDELIKAYLADYKNTGTRHGQLQPHIFHTVTDAYLNMRRTGFDQTIILSGESGSGKSYTKMLAFRMLLALRESSKKETYLMNQITNATDILEAFGNAQTATNENASQFGNYTEIQFNERGRVIGAKIMDYMLDKSRLTSSSGEQRNFHIFRYLHEGATPEEKSQLQFNENLPFNYLNSGSTDSDNTRYTPENFARLKKAFKSLGLNRKYQVQIFRLLSAILHLGNITFVDHPKRISEPATVKNIESLEIAAKFLGVEPASLEAVLTNKTQLINGEICSVFLNSLQAAAQRDVLARSLYSLLFSWLVEFLNTKICSDNQNNFLGLVDLLGQHNFPVNNFQEFCVNFANERLFHYCTQYLLEYENEEYAEQGITIVPNVTFADNTPCLYLFMKPQTGLFAILESQTTKNRTDLADEEVLQAFASDNQGHPNFTVPQGTNSNFMVQHYCGPVNYQVTGFLEKNTEIIGPDFVGLFKGSAEFQPTTNSFVSGLFTEKTVTYESHPRNEKAIIAAQQPAIPRRRPSVRKPRKPDTEKTSKKVSCVASQFQGALGELIESLKETEPWFVFCINPRDASNKESVANITKISEQVSHLGLAKIAERKQVEFVSAMTQEEFVKRYDEILTIVGVNVIPDLRQKCLSAKHVYEWSDKEMAVGKSKVYLCYDVWRELEDSLRAKESENKQRRRAHESQALSQLPEGVESQYDPRLTKYTSGYTYAPSYVASPSIDQQSLRSGHADHRSYYSDDDFFERSASESVVESETYTLSHENLRSSDLKKGYTLETEPVEVKDVVSTQRKRWLCCTWGLTWWVPSFCLKTCGKMKRPDIQIAWREKTALCIIIFLLCLFVLFFLIFFGQLICPRQYVFSEGELATYNTKDSPYVSIRGEAFTLKDFNHRGVTSDELIKAYAGRDVGQLLFPVQVSFMCDGRGEYGISPAVVLENYTDLNAQYHDYRYSKLGDNMKNFYQDNVMALLRTKRLKGQMAHAPETVMDAARNQDRRWAIINNMVYDLNSYSRGQRYAIYPPNTIPSGPIDLDFMDPDLVTLFVVNKGEDITDRFNKLYSDNPLLRDKMKVCLQNLFYVGVVDTRNSAQCKFSNYVLLACSIFLGSVLLFKFLAALQLGSIREPEDQDKFVVCQVPCYTESEDSLRRTIDSLTVLKYDDKRKLLFIVADGMIVGGGNDRPTPRIVLDILGVDPSVDPEALAYKALGEGNHQLNMAKVYSGLYECAGHVVPYLVVVKVGKPTERSRPGNRGKRDSQLILMHFFNKVHFNKEMCPLELEMYHQIKDVIGVDPFYYEFVLMVDADTIVMSDSLNHMIACMLHDTKIMGICGETQLMNEKATFITMIQVYEYFISHHLNKAFESLFGSVTCLPGCFCMYRFRTPTKNQPLLVANAVIEDYSENKVDTLHKKNLLSLGEDRYLTTLMLKHFNYNKMTFTPAAKCQTNAPDTWSVLLSQRRRWINSTVHNLAELLYLEELCGFCCFSMRFVVFLDLLSTIIMPIQCIYLGYLIYKVASDPSAVPLVSLLLLACIYGFQVFIFLLKRQWQHIGWMIIYLISLPVFSMFLPIYSFWHFDDFSWGNTRVVLGEKGKVAHVSSEESFDPSSIPLKKWSDYEQEVWEMGTVASHESRESKRSTGSHGSRVTYVSKYSRNEPPATIYGSPSIYAGQSSAYISGVPSSYTTVPTNTPSMYGGPPMGTPRVYDHDRSMSPIAPRYSTSPRSVTGRAASRSQEKVHTRNFGGGEPRFAFPGDSEIVDEIRVILSNADLMAITKKQVRDELSAHFHVDMNLRKDYVNSCIDMILQGRL
ncbi:hypothetical protein K493DRAFT_209876 [Basidiobolus meristosporus CBS 931.73]|uniref:chitin synthase n=1 Tax=Basidiobolus meristosporus CBS 931.73 TaxID=1314790 RepID=A0A1Y1YT86_9FUNG|nr:hypothetical protein K493DRAFT_209876 [Basidiobolus meristosporus CBS 931.73]|eukprot:ORY01252.1 hypothetical protein K493DRAFT_209876 [Basidiobolus meristosporus CBS 931.73]